MDRSTEEGSMDRTPAWDASTVAAGIDRLIRAVETS
jgi:hypothetical protein